MLSNVVAEVACFWFMGYPPTDQISHYFFRHDVDRNEQVDFVVPGPVWFNGNFVVVRSDHGVVFMRVSMGELNSPFLIWNPLTNKDRLIPGDTHKHCCLSMSVFGFGYLEDSEMYRIVHVFKCNHTEDKMRWTLFKAWEKGWNYDGTIESAIVKLGSKSVVQNGRVHWLGWEAIQDIEPSHIAIFDLERTLWRDSEIPHWVKTTYHSLTEFNEGVAFISYQNVGINRSVQVWKLTQDGGEGILWEKMIRVSGLGIPQSPTLMAGHDIISVLDCRDRFGAANDRHRTDLWITRLKHKLKSVEQLLHNTWQEELCLKTITMHSESLYKVL
ncbi:hypothetical protein PIB30_028543 [Stylosanthes scabra]|uniref:F-box associated beta-propeller type 1 domain-containing protein n=1 Tax=Stylosanthes scabra TaxID=79078 RepID=A0ABU6SAR5_9FABA|nr:hypothetical protein [Stylosanthes scabra]